MLTANTATTQPPAVLQSVFPYQALALAPQAEAAELGETSQPGCLVLCTIQRRHQVGNLPDSSGEPPALVFLHSFSEWSVSSAVAWEVSKAENQLLLGLDLCTHNSSSCFSVKILQLLLGTWALVINKEPFIRLPCRARPSLKIRAFLWSCEPQWLLNSKNNVSFLHNCRLPHPANWRCWDS